MKIHVHGLFSKEECINIKNALDEDYKVKFNTTYKEVPHVYKSDANPVYRSNANDEKEYEITVDVQDYLSEPLSEMILLYRCLKRIGNTEVLNLDYKYLLDSKIMTAYSDGYEHGYLDGNRVGYQEGLEEER